MHQVIRPDLPQHLLSTLGFNYRTWSLCPRLANLIHNASTKVAHDARPVSQDAASSSIVGPVDNRHPHALLKRPRGIGTHPILPIPLDDPSQYPEISLELRASGGSQRAFPRVAFHQQPAAHPLTEKCGWQRI